MSQYEQMVREKKMAAQGQADGAGNQENKIINIFNGARTSIKNKFLFTTSSSTPSQPTQSQPKKSGLFTYFEKKEQKETIKFEDQEANSKEDTKEEQTKARGEQESTQNAQNNV